MYLRLGLGDSFHLYIDGFNFIHKHCPTRTGSGVALYNYSTKLNQTTCKHWLSVDYVLIPILQNFYLSRSLNLRRKTSLLASSTGRQTKELMTFYKKNNELLTKISRENKICFIMGDFNLNLFFKLSTASSHWQILGCFFIQICFSHDKSACVRENSAHCKAIDDIYRY